MLLVFIFVSCLLHISTAQTLNKDNGQLNYNLPFIIVPVVVFILAIIGIIFGGYLVYRARYGAFGCCGPRMRYKVRYSDEESKSEEDLPPYKANPDPIGAPPNYDDALQDKVTTENIENTSDTVPLNP